MPLSAHRLHLILLRIHQAANRNHNGHPLRPRRRVWPTSRNHGEPNILPHQQPLAPRFLHHRCHTRDSGVGHSTSDSACTQSFQSPPDPESVCSLWFWNYRTDCWWESRSNPPTVAFGIGLTARPGIGSWAAGVQSAWYGAGIPAGSWFAIMQRAGAVWGFTVQLSGMGIVAAQGAWEVLRRVANGTGHAEGGL